MKIPVSTKEADQNSTDESSREFDPPLTEFKTKSINNNHHVVLIGIFVVLCTIYVIIAGLQRNCMTYSEPGVTAHNSNAVQDLNQPTESQKMILKKFACRQVDVFTKEALELSIPDHVLLKTPQAKPKLNRHRKGNGKLKLSKIANSRKEIKDKKSNSAEPIIYLFALVFIYLLVKAASDINQHYKSKNKGDKRLRRCSLQSYAQAHKQDRRASKDSSIRAKRKPLTEARSISVDRYKDSRSIFVSSLRKQISLMDHATYTSSSLALNKRLELQPSSMLSSRRCSVPVSINYQTVQMQGSVPGPQLLRRSSILNINSGSQGGLNILDGGVGAVTGTPLEPKRRVRMINRH